MQVAFCLQIKFFSQPDLVHQYDPQPAAPAPIFMGSKSLRNSWWRIAAVLADAIFVLSFVRSVLPFMRAFLSLMRA